MPTDLWSDSFLDEMRTIGDPPADELMEPLLREPQDKAKVALVNMWLQSDDASFNPHIVPRSIGDFVTLPEQAFPLGLELSAAKRAQDWFRTWGAFGLLGLSMYALPKFFLDSNAAHVFDRMEVFMPHSVYRLVVEVVHLLFHVMMDDLTLDPPSTAVLKFKKLRLHHAFVRDHVRKYPDLWNPSWGEPLNQEDMALAVDALCLYSMDAMARLDISLEDDVQAELLMMWRLLGFLLGVDDRLMPKSVSEARRFVRISGGRQYHSSDVGKRLTRLLLQAIERVLPVVFKDFPAAMMRYLMEPELARDLGVPGASTIEGSIDSPAGLLKALPHLAGILDGRALEALLKGFYDAPGRHGTRTPFAIHPSMRFTPHPLHKLNPLVPRA